MTSSRNVVSLRPTRPTRANSQRSKGYSDRRQSETRARRHLVSLMEEALFTNRGRARPGRGIPFLEDEVEFDAGIGLIYYYYSESLRRYILIDYVIHDGSGGGGEPRALAGCWVCTGQKMAVGWARAMAQASASPFRRFAALLVRIASMGIPAVYLPDIGPWLSHVRSINRATLRDVTRVRLVIRSCQSDVHPACLPDWSLLRRFVMVPEQLDNVYARAILAGEALSRLGGEADLALFIAPYREPADRPWNSGLLAESNTLIDALFGDRAAAKSCRPLRYFATRFLVDGDLLADDRRLRLIKSEITLRFAASIARSAAALQTRIERDTMNPGDLDRCADLMHRCARLSEFVRLSNLYLGSQRHAGAELSIVDELEGFDSNARKQVRCLVSGLSEFGNSSSALVYLMTNWGDETPSEPDAMGDIHGRLRSLASEILSPSG